MFKKYVHLTLFCVLFISACGGISALPTASQEPGEGSLPTLTGAWTITMTHSGGIMGLSRSVQIDSSGIYTVKDDRAEETLKGQLSEEELGELMYEVNSASYTAEKTPHGCADCFIYDLQITSDTGNFSAQVDDISIEESGLSNLVMYLRGIIEREIK
jgi:hypothetical protein